MSSLSQNNGNDIGKELDRQLSMRRIMMRLLALKPEIRGIALITAGGKVYQLGDTGKTIDDDILKEQD